MFYCSRQVENIFPYCKPPIEYFIIGGPADGNEAQVFKEKFKETKIIGFEPCMKSYNFQIDNKFPGILYNKALWHQDHEMLKLNTTNNDMRGMSLVNYPSAENGQICEAFALDSLLKGYPDINNIVLWIDIEGSEFQCLSGAKRLIDERRIKLINIEMNSDNKDEIVKVLNSHGFKLEKEWNVRKLTRTISDGIFVLEGK